MRKVIIYGLMEDGGGIVYVGKTTSSVKTRLTNHIYKAISGRSTFPVCVWIKDLMARGKRPEAVVLETAPDDGSWAEMERRWIAKLSASNRLLNVIAGGNGSHVRKELPAWAIDLLGKISDARIGEQVGLTREAIKYHRNRMGIPASNDKTRVRGVKGRIPWNKKQLPCDIVSILGTRSDRDIAMEIGVSTFVIQHARVALGIKSCYEASGDHSLFSVKGERHHAAKMSESEVRELRSLRATGWKIRELASKYGIDATTVSNIATGKTWKKIL